MNDSPEEARAAVEASQRGLTKSRQLELAQHPSLTVREYLASNPDLSIEAFRVLELDTDVWAALIRNPNLPDDVIERMVIADNPAMSPARILQHRNTTRIAFGFANESQPHEEDEVDDSVDFDPLAWVSQEDSPAENGLWRRHQDYAAIYMRSEPSGEKLSDDWLLERWSASLSFTPDFVLERITEKLAPRLAQRQPIISEYADNPQVARDLQAADDSQQLLRTLASVAQHPNTNSVTLRTIQEIQHPLLNVLVAEHPRTSQPILKRILNDPDPNVRAAVARHRGPKVQKLLKELLQALDEAGLADLAKNPHLSPSAVWAVLEHPTDAIRAAAASNPNLPSGREAVFCHHQNPLIRAGLASNPAASKDTLTKLSEDPDARVVQEVAANPSTDPAVLRQLIQASQVVRTALAGNTKAPTDLLEQLAADESHHAALAANPATPTPILEAILHSGSIDSLRIMAEKAADSELLDVISRNADPVAQWRCVNNKHLSDTAAANLQTHGSQWYIRRAARRRLLLQAGDADAPTPLEQFKAAITNT